MKNATKFLVLGIVFLGLINIISASSGTTCLIGYDFGDTSIEIPNQGAEPTLDYILGSYSHSFDIENDQSQEQLWEAGKDIQLTIKFLNGFSSYQDVFGYYKDNGQFVGLFELGNHPGYNLPIVSRGDTFTVNINAGEKFGFAIDVNGMSIQHNGIYTTEISKNPDSSDHAIAFRNGSSILLGFDDTFGDWDYQDVVVEIKTNCDDSPVCGNEIEEQGEQCDLGIANGNVCDPGYQNLCVYCTDTCALKTVFSTEYCGDNVVQPEHEQCDDGNYEAGDGCYSCQLEGTTCEHDVGVRYSYSNSFGTGIAIKNSSGLWIVNPAELMFGENYTIKYYIDNKIENTTNNIHVTLAIGETMLADYTDSINNYHYKEISFDSSQFALGDYTVTLEVEKVNETDCNLSDNTAVRNISFVEENGGFCGDENVDTSLGEQCDLGADNGKKCDNANSDCSYCSSSCQWVDLKEKSSSKSSGSSGSTWLSFPCEPIWECSGWGECYDGIRTRNCEDLNNCISSYNEPTETTICDNILKTSVEPKKTPKEIFFIIALLIAIIILLAVNLSEF